MIAEETLDSRRRLAEIGHHFLSDADEAPSPWQETRITPLLLVAREDDFIAYRLQDALEARGHRCAVLNIEQQQRRAGQAGQPAPEVCLLPLTAVEGTLAVAGECLLMAVPACLAGVRLAYHHLAQLAEQGRRVRLQVIMLDARSEAHGRRCFDFLRDAAQSLLSLELHCLGVLPAQTVVDDRAGEGVEEKDAEAAMDEVVAGLLPLTGAAGACLAS